MFYFVGKTSATYLGSNVGQWSNVDWNPLVTTLIHKLLVNFDFRFNSLSGTNKTFFKKIFSPGSFIITWFISFYITTYLVTEIYCLFNFWQHQLHFYASFGGFFFLSSFLLLFLCPCLILGFQYCTAMCEITNLKIVSKLLLQTL